ncbi:hypothetical protein [Nocardioides sp. CER19]|uniref:hypothetical protein n=1 Tax=Nocardioides sp. CER19 TaxID=3038538 RepID=UPI0024499C71|nr:hypothetical protein [Nocardioides sp. CER19]MDH2414067.1 hypothetical protein [Nocardioides sp. CER19]
MADLHALRRRALGSAPVAVLALGLLVLAGALVAHARKLWFYGDDWAFLLHRSLRDDTLHTLFVPHNEHWSTIPVLVFRTLFALYGAGSYLPYAVMPIAAHLVAAALLFLVLRRAGLSPWVSVLTALTFAFLAGGAGAENTLWDFQVGFLGSAAFGVAALLALQGWTRPWRIVAGVALVLALMCSGMGIMVTGWAVLFVLLRRGLVPAVVTGVAPAVVYAVWYLAIGHGYSSAPAADLTVAPQAALNGLADVWTSATGMAGAGPAVMIVLAAVVLLRRHTPDQFALGASGLVMAVGCFFAIGYARSGFGADALTAHHRYLYFALLMTTPALGLAYQVAADQLRLRPPAALLAWAVAAVVVCWVGLAQAALFAEQRAGAVQTVKNRLVAAREVATSGERLLTDSPDRFTDPDITVDHLLGVLRGLPRGASATTQARLDARASLQVGVARDSFGLPSATAVSWSGFSGIGPGDHPLTSCATATAGEGARIGFTSDDAGRQLRVTATGPLETGIAAKGGLSALGGWRYGSEPLYVGVTAPGVRARVYVPPGPVTVCPG